MPTFNALGVRATLSVSSLQGTLTDEVILTMGAGVKKRTERIADVIASGRNLLERPVGADGSEKGVLQYIGNNEDMALFMVEVEDTSRMDAYCPLTLLADAAAAGSNGSISELTSFESSQSSALSELGLTSSFGTPSFQAQHSIGKEESALVKSEPADEDDVLDPALRTPPVKRGKPKPRSRKPRAPKSPSPAEILAMRAQNANATQQRIPLDVDSGPKALTLTIDYTQQTFMGRDVRANDGRDLKFEVFMNGHLVDVSFISNRRSAGGIAKKGDFQRFSGTRFHRQTEKPWVYNEGGHPRRSDDIVGADKRWDAISMALMTEAQQRGTNKYGDFSPSAEYLSALATKPLPDRLRSKGDRLGIIDVVITSGAGRKYGPDTSYLQVPTRMDDAKYNRGSGSFSSAMDQNATADDMLDNPFTSALQDTPSRRPAPFSTTHSSQEASDRLNVQRSPAPKFTLDMFEKSPVKKQIQRYENAHGKVRKGRTISQRLADLNKMSPKKQAAAWEELQQELDDDVLSAIKQEDKAEQPGEHDLAPIGKLNLDQQHAGFARMTREDDMDADPVKTGYIDPQLLSPTRQGSFQDDVDPEAMLTQQRIDMALGAGLPSNGHLLRRVASTSPRRTPPRKTRAASLANSPTVQPVKDQPHMTKQKQKAMTVPSPPKARRVKTPTKPRRRADSTLSSSPLTSYDELDSAFVTPKHQRTTNPDVIRSGGRSGCGSNRSARRWEPKELTPEEALEAFEIPELCKGSVISYAGGNAQRQIQKARHGEFQEEVLAVGMRFVVL